MVGGVILIVCLGLAAGLLEAGQGGWAVIPFLAFLAFLWWSERD